MAFTDRHTTNDENLGIENWILDSEKIQPEEFIQNNILPHLAEDTNVLKFTPFFKSKEGCVEGSTYIIVGSRYTIVNFSILHSVLKNAASILFVVNSYPQ